MSYIKEVANEIATKGFKEYAGRILTSEMGAMADKAAAEAGQKLTQNISTYISKNEIKDIVTSNFKNVEKANEMIGKINTAYNRNNIDEVKNLLSMSGDEGRRAANNITEKYNKYMQDPKPEVIWVQEMLKKTMHSPVRHVMTPDAAIDLTDVGGPIYNLHGYKHFFHTENEALNAERRKVVVGGYFVGANGLRVLQGGTPLKNENGETDIAGIPFI